MIQINSRQGLRRINAYFYEEIACLHYFIKAVNALQLGMDALFLTRNSLMMAFSSKIKPLALIIFFIAVFTSQAITAENTILPIPLERYTESEEYLRESLNVEKLPLKDVLWLRIQEEPFNLVATVLFFCAILHTFLSGKFHALAHKMYEDHRIEVRRTGKKTHLPYRVPILNYLGEVEVIFGLWVIPLFILMAFRFSFSDAVAYLETRNFTEPLFVVVIMSIAASYPIVALAKRILEKVASIGKKTPAAWWLSILTVAPLLGSFITEPAAMTIAAMLLASQFYSLNPSLKLKYATIGLLFVNISVGGTLTHFAAPPVLMVAGTWEWTTPFMLATFGWKAALGIFCSNFLYYIFFRKEFSKLAQLQSSENTISKASNRKYAPSVSWLVILFHVCFLAWTVINSHHPVMFIGGYLFYIGFTVITSAHQIRNDLRLPILVGFFLAGLVIHGGLQSWWIEPVLKSFGATELFAGATILTAFNDNAAITYLASQVPSFMNDRTLQIAVVAGAITGGGLTLIANAPNPAGQSILKKYFNDELSPIHIFFGALIPTIIMAAVFLLL